MNCLTDILNQSDSDVLAIKAYSREDFNEFKRSIVLQHTTGCGLDEQTTREIVSSALVDLHAAATRAFRRGDVSRLDEALIKFDGELLERFKEKQAQLRERNSFRGQIVAAMGKLRAFCYGRAEVAALEVICGDGDEIVDIGFDEIIVDRDGTQRAISRADLINATMPTTSSFESWKKAGNFVSDKVVADARAQTERAAFAEANPSSGRSIIHPDGSVTSA